jgi:hypothetical protein
MAASTCSFCRAEGPKYICPKCNATYCNLQCYRSPRHVQCAEKFYKDCVKDELELRAEEDKTSISSRSHMIDVLKKMQREEELENDSDEEGIDSDDDELDLADRVAGLDLDDADAIWNNLTETERKEFERLVETGDIEKMVPKFEAWWEKKADEKFVIVVGEGDKEFEDIMKACPEIDTSFPPLESDMCAKASPLIKFGLLNVLYAYAYGVRFYKGDHDAKSNIFAFVELILTLSDNLGKQANFASADEAVESAASNVNIHNNWTVSPKFTKNIKKDVFAIVRGPKKDQSSFYLKCALSDMKRIFASCYKKRNYADSEPNELDYFEKVKSDLPPWKRVRSRFIELDPKAVKKASKKIEFYLSWVAALGHEYDMLRQ